MFWLKPARNPPNRTPSRAAACGGFPTVSHMFYPPVIEHMHVGIGPFPEAAPFRTAAAALAARRAPSPQSHRHSAACGADHGGPASVARSAPGRHNSEYNRVKCKLSYYRGADLWPPCHKHSSTPLHTRRRGIRTDCRPNATADSHSPARPAARQCAARYD